MNSLIAKHPSLLVVLAISAGLLGAKGEVPYAVVLGVLCLLLGWRSRFKFIALFLGILLGGIHHIECQRLSVSEGLFNKYSGTSFPLEVPAAKVCEVKKGSAGYTARVKLLADAPLRGTGEILPENTFLRVSAKDILYPGEVIQFTGNTLSNLSLGNYGEMSWREQRRKKGEAGSVMISSHQILAWSAWRRANHDLREKLKAHFLASLSMGVPEDSPSLQLLPALLFGQEGDGNEWQQRYRDAGVMHMFVVSGLHVGMVMGVAWIFFYPLPLLNRSVLVLALVVAWFYAWLTGLNPPVFRSALVITVFSSGVILGRRVGAVNSLLVAFVLVVSFNRFALNDVGVWLSFGVVLGLLLLARVIMRVTERKWSPDIFLPKVLYSLSQKLWGSIVKWGVGILVTSLVAWGVSSLISLASFERVYVLGVVSTWMLLPALFCLMAVSFLVFLLSPFPMLLAPLNTANHHLCLYVERVVERVDQVPWAVHYANDNGYKGTLTVFNSPKGGAALFLGVEEGILVDTGKERFAKSNVLPILEKSGCEVQQVVISHRDSGHHGGATLFKNAETLPAYQGSGMKISREGWTVETLPLRVPSSDKGDDQVALIRFTKDGHSIGYLSDAGYPIFKELKASGTAFPCDVLICGDNAHGETVIEDFLAYTGARYLILGRTYFHAPKRKVIGVTTYDQRYCGAVRVEIQAGELKISPFRPE